MTVTYTDDEIAIGPDARGIEDQAAFWAASLHNRRDWTNDHQKQLDNWLDASLAHRVAFLRVNATWKRADRLAALRKPMRSPEAAPRHPAIQTRIAVGIGAAFIAGAVFVGYLERPQAQLVETPRGGHELLTLGDGSQVELNTDTAIKVDFRGATRQVELVKGEAYFRVRHDPSHPFVVNVGRHRVVDLGTKFLIRMTPQSTKVALVEGRAQFESSVDTQRAIVLAPGDVAIASLDRTQVIRKTSKSLQDDLAWQRGMIVFRDERLADAVNELNRYGGPMLRVAGESASKLKINGTFLTGRPEEFAGAAHEIFGIHVTQQNGVFVLSR